MLLLLATAQASWRGGLVQRPQKTGNLSRRTELSHSGAAVAAQMDRPRRAAKRSQNIAFAEKQAEQTELRAWRGPLTPQAAAMKTQRDAERSAYQHNDTRYADEEWKCRNRVRYVPPVITWDPTERDPRLEHSSWQRAENALIGSGPTDTDIKALRILEHEHERGINFTISKREMNDLRDLWDNKRLPFSVRIWFAFVNKGFHDAASFMLDHGVDVNQVDRNGVHALSILISAIHHTPAPCSCYRMTSALGQNEDDKLDMVRMLLRRGADVAQADDYPTAGFAPLYIACFRGHIKIATLLLEHRADVNQKGARGQTPLFIAALRGHVEIATLLLDRGADVNPVTDSGATPLYIASQMGHTHIDMSDVALPLSMPSLDRFARMRGIDLNAVIGTERIDMLRLLLDRGANVNQANNCGVTPLDTACSGPAYDQRNASHDSQRGARPVESLHSQRIMGPEFYHEPPLDSDVAALLVERGATRSCSGPIKTIRRLLHEVYTRPGKGLLRLNESWPYFWLPWEYDRIAWGSYPVPPDEWGDHCPRCRGPRAESQLAEDRVCLGGHW